MPYPTLLIFLFCTFIVSGSLATPVRGIEKLGAYIGTSEIVAYDKTSKQMYVVGGGAQMKIISIANPAKPTLVRTIGLSAYGQKASSVAVSHNRVAVAIKKGSVHKQQYGTVVFFDTTGKQLQTVTVGFSPDMLSFTQDGSKVVIANEGEPNQDYSDDPKGSIGIIELSDYRYTDIGFEAIALSKAHDGTPVRLGATPSKGQAKDLEPEYVTISDHFAYVSLQENNAIAKVDLRTNTLVYVKSLGAKPYAESSGNTIDIEEEGRIKLQHYPGLYGLYQPDAIASYTVDDKTYLVTANEGSSRKYTGRYGFVDEKKISKLRLDNSIAAAYKNENDLKVMTDLGDANNDGRYETLYTYGTRSFAIWDEAGDLIWDSGDAISKKIAELEPENFNQNDGEMDGRSGNKGSEPETVALGETHGKTYAFIGLERQNAILIYDISTPHAPVFINYHSTEADGHVSPEGLVFVSAKDSPTGEALLLAAFEYNPGDAPQATAIYKITY